MAKSRQRDPSLIRTYPVTFLHDHTEQRFDRAWHQLTFATRGHLEVVTETARLFVPADRAVWIPAGMRHTTVMRAPITMRSIFVAASYAPALTKPRTIAVAPLLRELILHVTYIGALDRSVPAHVRLAAVMVDQLSTAKDVAAELPSPRDPRARRFAELVIAADRRSSTALARVAGASLRTLERLFVTETGMALGAWRREIELFRAQRLLALGQSATEVALEIGYATPSAFTHAYRTKFGVTPKRDSHAR
ncbi:MAG: helix-turn-helix transcriptional regulator [Kofleriaceae bacterium]